MDENEIKQYFHCFCVSRNSLYFIGCCRLTTASLCSFRHPLQLLLIDNIKTICQEQTHRKMMMMRIKLQRKGSCRLDEY